MLFYIFIYTDSKPNETDWGTFIIVVAALLGSLVIIICLIRLYAKKRKIVNMGPISSLSSPKKDLSHHIEIVNPSTILGSVDDAPSLDARIATVGDLDDNIAEGGDESGDEGEGELIHHIDHVTTSDGTIC